MSSKSLSSKAKESYQKENRKISLSCTVNINKNKPISINVKSNCNLNLYKDLKLTCTLDYIPIDAKNKPLDAQVIIRQLSKTSNTPYVFQNISINLDDNVFLPKISALNELRRTAIDMVREFATKKIHRNLQENGKMKVHNREIVLNNMRKINTATVSNHNTRISLLLNKLNTSYDYSKLDNIDNIYIPLKYFINRKYSSILQILSQKSEIYVYLPTIIKGNYKNLLYAHIENSVQKYDIKGFVISNICNIKLLNDLFTDLDKYFKIIANYTFNVFNSQTVLELKKLGVSQFTISPELDKQTITNLCNYGYLQKELIVYGKIPVLNMNYCLLRSN